MIFYKGVWVIFGAISWLIIVFFSPVSNRKKKLGEIQFVEHFHVFLTRLTLHEKISQSLGILGDKEKWEETLTVLKMARIPGEFSKYTVKIR